MAVNKSMTNLRQDKQILDEVIVNRINKGKLVIHPQDKKKLVTKAEVI